MQSIHFESYGDGDPIMLITGLGGVGKSWGQPLIDRFARKYFTVVPDHPGTGQSPSPPAGYTIDHHAGAMAAVLRQLGVGPAHLVGSSTGGAIAQVMALDHPDVTRSIVLADSWAKPDAYFRHQFAVRRRILTELGPRAYAEASALFLFGPSHFRDHFSQIEGWIDQAGQADVAIGTQRIDMILAFDESERLSDIRVPSLVVAGDVDICTPVPMSEQLVELIPGATLQVLDGGHLIYQERPEAFFAVIDQFLASIPVL